MGENWDFGVFIGRLTLCYLLINGSAFQPLFRVQAAEPGACPSASPQGRLLHKVVCEKALLLRL